MVTAGTKEPELLQVARIYGFMANRQDMSNMPRFQKYIPQPPYLYF
jgi:hypothetical protein